MWLRDRGRCGVGWRILVVGRSLENDVSTCKIDSS